MTTVAPAPGEVIGDYEILDRIGGNMGLVFKARHRLLDKVVVLKLVPSEWIADPARLGRFQREIRAMGQLEHPNLVTAADARSVGDWHLVSMELIDGVDLQQLVRARGPLPIAAACEAARQAAQGLQYAHEHGLIHRDIKPSNLMLTRAGTIKVIDMGLALIRDDSTAQLTQTGLVLGTMSYCAPEQFRDAAHVDIRADIYSLGCTLYHLLTGKSPYWQRKTFPEIVQAHLHDPFPSLAEALPDAPAGLEAVLVRMIAKDRDARFSTPKEVVEALEPFAQGAELGPLVPAKTSQSAPPRITTRKPTYAQPVASSGQQPRAFWPRMAALFVALLVIASAVVTLMPRDPKSLPSSDVPKNRRPVVVLMDTTVERGIYDPDNKARGRSNAKELIELLRRELPEVTTHEVPVDEEWARQDYVRSLRPDLIVVHRSVFYHPAARKLNLRYPDEFNSHAEYENFEKWYKILGDDKLADFLETLAGALPDTKFLVYSRGTDTNWLSPSFQLEWTASLEVRFQSLKGRVKTMLIEKIKHPDGTETATFRNQETRMQLLQRVSDMLEPMFTNTEFGYMFTNTFYTFTNNAPIPSNQGGSP